MKGTNTLVLNKVTLIDALQQYFNAAMFEDEQFLVESITFDNSDYTASVVVKEKSRKTESK